MINRKQAIFQITALLVSSMIPLSSCFKNTKILKVDAKKRILISRIAETIIPKTDTPGANEAGVVTYIVNIIENCLSNRDRTTVLVGLDDVEEYAMRKYSSLFNGCKKKEKIAIIGHFQNKGTFDNAFLNKVRNKLVGPSFFELIKDLSVKAYCTSQTGASQGLAYEHIPVSYQGCVPLLASQRSWATA